MEAMAREGTGDPRSTSSDRRLDRVEKQIQDLRVEGRTEFTQLRGEMNAGFTQLRGEMNQGFTQLRGEMKEGFARIDGRLDAMQRTMVQALIAMTAAILAGFGGTLVLIATQI
jgi:DNA anti-recombination protein RmuC